MGKIGAREIENSKRTGVEGANGTLAASNGMTGAAADPRLSHHYAATTTWLGLIRRVVQCMPRYSASQLDRVFSPGSPDAKGFLKPPFSLHVHRGHSPATSPGFLHQ
jgi:hypothetical protein